MSILTAQVASVKIGLLEIEGLMNEKGAFGVGVPQIAKLFPYFHDSQDKASQKLKRLMGEGFKTHKAKTEFNRNATLLIQLEEFVVVLKKLARIGDPVAQDMVDDLVGMSLTQLFADAFNIKFEKEERQEFLKTRQEGKQVRHTLTDAIKWYLCVHADTLSNAYVNFIYSNCSDLVNLGLFGRKSKRLCVDLKVSDRSKLRDALKADELRWLTEIEDLAARLIMYQEYEPMAAIKEAISRTAIPVVERVA